MNGFNLQASQYNNKPTEEHFERLQKMSVSIADQIQDWLEKDINEETPEEKEAKRLEAEAEANRLKEEEDKKKQHTPTAIKKGVHEKSLEAKVREKMTNNEISSTDLYAIIGTNNLDTFNNEESIGALSLKKVYLSDRYRAE
jgi:regulator of protease activity HflC (stomatin/prohibitin superfamily)